MVVVDSSALIPPAWVGRLDLLDSCFDEIRTTEGVRDDATDVLYDLVDEGMNLHPKVYTQVQRKLHELGED